MLRDQLLKEAEKLQSNASIELDRIFESVELSGDVKANLTTVFETAVKKQAAQLAESYIEEVVERADALLEEQLEQRAQETEDTLVEAAETYLGIIAEKWLEENKEATHNVIKSNLFESLLDGMKQLFVEHNIEVPEDAVDVVEELEQEIAEQQLQTHELVEELREAKAEVNALRREKAINEATEHMTYSQREQVQEMMEGVDSNWESNLRSVVSLVENRSENKYQNQMLNENLNYYQEEPRANSTMNMYVKAAAR